MELKTYLNCLKQGFWLANKNFYLFIPTALIILFSYFKFFPWLLASSAFILLTFGIINISLQAFSFFYSFTLPALLDRKAQKIRIDFNVFKNLYISSVKRLFIFFITLILLFIAATLIIPPPSSPLYIKSIQNGLEFIYLIFPILLSPLIFAAIIFAVENKSIINSSFESIKISLKHWKVVVLVTVFGLIVSYINRNLYSAPPVPYAIYNPNLLIPYALKKMMINLVDSYITFIEGAFLLVYYRLKVNPH